MNFTYDFSLTTPALIFPAISLLMLAYTNRFVVLADLIRNLYERQQTHPQQQNIDQIENLKYRMFIIKRMQIFGSAAFITAAVSMLFAMLNISLISMLLFALSLILLVISLTYLLKELTVSIDALTIQLDDIEDHQK